jgi:hypothetical protein
VLLEDRHDVEKCRVRELLEQQDKVVGQEWMFSHAVCLLHVRLLGPLTEPDKFALAFPCRSAAPRPRSSHALAFRFAVSAGAGVGTSSAFNRAIPQPHHYDEGLVQKAAATTLSGLDGW